MSGQRNFDSETMFADFETAIAASGFGVFNIRLLLTALPAAVATVFETSTISYVLPSAECDLQLDLVDKGIVNAMTYAGIITSAFMWGYLADTRGRKKILIYGYLVDVLCVLGGAFSQNKWQLMIFKYLGGFVICGPYAVLMSYLTELHGKQYRARVMMSVGMMLTVATLLLPALALWILPMTWSTSFVGLQFNSWRLYIVVSAIPSLLSGLFFTLFPESPKFLMSRGHNSAALEVFRNIYAINTRQEKQHYPVTELIVEVAADSEKGDRRPRSRIFAALAQLRPLLRKPFLGLSLRVCIMNFCILVGQSTVILWLPQLFASISEFQQISPSAPTMCDIIEYSMTRTAALENMSMNACQMPVSNATYSNNVIVALSALLGYIIAGLLVNTVGDKLILIVSLFSAGSSGIALYWSSTSLSTLLITTSFVTMGNIAMTTVINASVNLFPTSLRTIVVSLATMLGRCGSLLGNVMFPIFMSFGCIPPFLLISSVMFVAGLFAIFVPQTNKMSLK